MAGSDPFWKTKRLDDMTGAEWESLCDGCGRCCLHKLRHEGSGDLSFTNVACRLLDLETCQCSDYKHRRRRVPDCVQLTPQALRADIVAFAKSRGLFAGISVQGSIISSDSGWDQAYYGKPLAAQQIVLQGEGSNPGAQPLREMLLKFSG